MGFSRIILPKQNADKLKKIDGLQISGAKTLREAIKMLG
mgnify:FL=1